MNQNVNVLTEENNRLRELLELCSKLLWKLDKEGFIGVSGLEEDEAQCEHLRGLAHDAVAETREFLGLLK